MSCSNCYNGCAEITSDKCVRYTGLDVPELGISNGDSLASVEQALSSYLISVMSGAGINIEGLAVDYCDLIQKYLPISTSVNIVDLFAALLKSACDIQAQVDGISTTLTQLNADYVVDCLEVVTNSSDTHDVLQAVIDKLCGIDTSVAALALDLDTNYVKLADLNSLIQAYLDSISTSTKLYNKMVPYTAVEYYGSLSNFDATGAGVGDWEKIYLCNGLNGTPDKRGRVGVGAIAGVPGGTLDPAVNPGSSAFNPNYALGDAAGANTFTIPASGTQGAAGSVFATPSVPATYSVIQPVRACYYIMYIPS
jgi:hypothetical protein